MRELNKKEACDLILEKYSVSKDEAILIYEALEPCVEDIYEFIEDELEVHKTAGEAYDYLYGEHDGGIIDLISTELVYNDITKDMIGKSIGDVLLESSNRCIKVKFNLYITSISLVLTKN